MILVTGGSGFIGSHLLDRILKMGLPVRALTRRPGTLPAGVEEICGDLLNRKAVEQAVEGVDTVIHLAGVIKALTPQGYQAGNEQASTVLARAVAGRNVRFVHVSSLAAAGPSPDGVPVNEDTPPHPVSNYGRSKLAGERAVRQVLPAAVIVRPPVVYGPRDTGVLQILRSVARGLVVEIGGGERWFSLIYVRDLVEGLLSAAHAPHADGRTYFLAHAKPLTWTALGQLASHIMSRRPRYLSIPIPVAKAAGGAADLWSALTRVPHIVSRDKVAEACFRWWTCDPGRAAIELPFRADTAHEAGLAETLAWYKEAGWIAY